MLKLLKSAEESNTKKDASTKDIYGIALVLAIILSNALRLINILAPTVNDTYHSFRTTETAIVVQDYFRSGFSLFHYSMPIFGKPWNLMFEFPLYQAIIYWVMRILHLKNIDLTGRVISIIIFNLSAFVLIKVVKKFADRKAAYLAGIVYLISMYNSYWSRSILIDYFSVLLGLMYILFFIKWLENDKDLINYSVALIVGTLGYMVKGTSMFAVVFLLACFIIQSEILLIKACEGTIIKKVTAYLSSNIRRIIMLFVLSVIPVIIGYAWIYYTDIFKQMSEYTQEFVADRLVSWNYGTIDQRLSPVHWIVIGRRYIDFLGNGYVFVAIIVVYLLFTKRKYLKYILYLLGAQLANILIIFNLFFVHNYYLIAITPYVYMMLGLMIYEIFDIQIKNDVVKKASISIIAVVLIWQHIFSNLNYLDGITKISSRNVLYGKVIKNITEYDDLLVIADEDWSPKSLYDSDRRGFMLNGRKISEDSGLKKLLDDDNYTVFIAHTMDSIEDYDSVYDELMQYPLDIGNGEILAEDVFIYKIPTEDVLNRSYSGEVAVDREYYYQVEKPGSIFKVNYKINETKILAGEVVDIQGNVHLCVVTLPKGRDHMYMDFSNVCGEVQAIRIDLSEDEKIMFCY